MKDCVGLVDYANACTHSVYQSRYESEKREQEIQTELPTAAIREERGDCSMSSQRVYLLPSAQHTADGELHPLGGNSNAISTSIRSERSASAMLDVVVACFKWLSLVFVK